jgi:hypothetical protein
MKVMLMLLFAFLSFYTRAQSDTVLKKYALIYTPGLGWDTTKTANNQLYFDKHSQFLSTMRREKRILFGGRYADKGLIIIQAKSDEEMRSLLKGDLMAENKIFSAVFYPLSVFYDGCIAK